MINTFLKSRICRFRKDETGAISAEAIIVFPLLLWLFGVGWVYFDAFRQQNVNQKANFVIADMISRETSSITNSYISNTYNLLLLLDQSTSANTDMRISVVQYDGVQKKWSVKWSKTRGTKTALTTITTDMATRLPSKVTHTEQLILVETWDDYAPVLKVGLNDFEIKTFSFTSPRYSAQIPYSQS